MGEIQQKGKTNNKENLLQPIGLFTLDLESVANKYSPTSKLTFLAWYIEKTYQFITYLSVSQASTSTTNRAGVRDPHANSGRWRDSRCIVHCCGLAKLNNKINLVHTWPPVYNPLLFDKGHVAFVSFMSFLLCAYAATDTCACTSAWLFHFLS